MSSTPLPITPRPPPSLPPPGYANSNKSSDRTSTTSIPLHPPPVLDGEDEDYGSGELSNDTIAAHDDNISLNLDNINTTFNNASIPLQSHYPSLASGAIDDESVYGGGGGGRTYAIAMVCDFFYPRFGGVESHLYQLSQCLIARGHKVVVLTHAYNTRHGVRYLSNGLKVYYLPFPPVYQASAFPSVFAMLPLFRNIFIRERIEIVHGHGAFSCMCHEAILHGRTMGLRVVFTDHSLFGFHDASSIHMNKVLKFTLSDIDHVICVSHTSKENTVLRAQLDPRDVSAIPNAVDTSVFSPNPAAKDHAVITLVVMSRLVYRKGIDLVIDLIPRVCASYPNVAWIIGGDGDRMLGLQEMLEEHQLHDRVEVLGEVAHEDVRDVLVRGDIFVNASLTEAFCIAIVEAVACGLSVVSTRVGGVPEVLPEHMIKLADPNPDDLMRQIHAAIGEVHNVHPHEFHSAVASMYNWHDVAKRTQVVYDRIITAPPVPLIERFRRYYGCGIWAGKLFCMLMALDYIFYCILEWAFPRSEIDIAPDFPTHEYESLSLARKRGNPNMANLMRTHTDNVDPGGQSGRSK